MELANLLYRYERFGESVVPVATIIEMLRKSNMAPYYTDLCAKFNWTVDETLLAEMTEENTKKITELEAAKEAAETNAGDTDVVEAMFSIAMYYGEIGSWTLAHKTYEEIINRPKTVTGKKIDCLMAQTKLNLLLGDKIATKSTLDEAKKLNEIGGDWDRRNRLKIYDAHYQLLNHDIKSAAALFLDCIATFSCVELCTYETFMRYSLLTNLITLQRHELYEKLLNDPNVITVQRDLPLETNFTRSLYDCEYLLFMKNMLEIVPIIENDRFLGSLLSYLIREYRILAYSQFLEAYKSVTLLSMATSFGFNEQFLDSELSRFISMGRLSAKIDRVENVIETRRPDKKNSQYQEVIKRGDELLNHIQKLVRAINV